MKAVVLSQAQPQRRTPVRVYQVKQAIKHATNLCANYEKTIECRLAWERDSRTLLYAPRIVARTRPLFHTVASAILVIVETGVLA